MRILMLLILAFSFLQHSVLAVLKNCNYDPLSDHCNDIYTWKSNDTCKEVASRFNISVDDIDSYNSYIDYSFYCTDLTEGDQICLDWPDYLSCGDYDQCYFDNPEYFCETYEVDDENTTCRDICNLFDLSLVELKEFNKYSSQFAGCDPDYIYEGDVFCVTKPNFTDWENCYALAKQDHDTYYASMYFTEVQTITALDPYYGKTETYEFYYDPSQSEYTTRTYNITSAIVTSLSSAYKTFLSEYSELGEDRNSLAAIQTSLFGTNHGNFSGLFSTNGQTSKYGTVEPTHSGTDSGSASNSNSNSNSNSTAESSVLKGDADTLKMFGVTFVIAWLSCLL